jgi:hypothetical protein
MNSMKNPIIRKKPRLSRILKMGGVNLTNTDVEFSGHETKFFDGRIGWGIESISVKAWLQGGAQGEPEGSEGHEDDEREGVADEELEHAAEY